MVAQALAGDAIEFTLAPPVPESVAVWMSTVKPERVAQLPSVAGLPSRCCPYTHFFASQETYTTWSQKLPGEIRPHIRCLPLIDAWAGTRGVLAACETTSPYACR